ncbi:UNVERIFIED_CONTAM: putative mitochondrial protein [Sesamum radiatum]|uniref:Mitochondrial protein n=1 Tax=Sesamum radiatum TaxID=300843 RepID=A0AAW2U883_SESRA
MCPERGLRQGDPLSPYLFLFCAEAFSSLIRKAENEGYIQGVAVSQRAPRISHLLFAEHTLIFCQATEEELFCVKNILSTYEKASGLVINSGKSAIGFSKNVDNITRIALAHIVMWTTLLE